MSVTTCTTLRLVQSLYHHHFALLTTGDYHLGDALTIVDDDVLLREVDQHDTNLTTMVPGAFSTVSPCFKASPLRGRTCAS